MNAKPHETKYVEARRAVLKSVVVAWLRADEPERSRVKRIWKHAEMALDALMLEQRKPSVLAGGVN